VDDKIVEFDGKDQFDAKRVGLLFKLLSGLNKHNTLLLYVGGLNGCMSSFPTPN